MEQVDTGGLQVVVAGNDAGIERDEVEVIFDEETALLFQERDGVLDQVGEVVV